MAMNDNITFSTSNPYMLAGTLTQEDIRGAVESLTNRPLLTDWGFKTEPEEVEWVWVTGYKATDKDMKCRDYQYELGKQHDMPEGEPIAMCFSGFHFCDKLRYTFKYYEIRNGNRFFEVKALVRRYKKSDYYYTEHLDDKMVAKSIILTRELTTEEVFAAVTDRDVKNWTLEQKERARQTSISQTKEFIKIDRLLDLGYSEAFAAHVVKNGAYDFAVVMGKTPDITMDTRIMAICMKMYSN